MRFMKYFVILSLIILTAGCLDNIFSMGQKSPVLYVDITTEEINFNDSRIIKLNENNSNSVVVNEVVIYGSELPKIKAPSESLADDVPAIYIRVIQDSVNINYPTGMDYKGPGNYNFTIGFEKDINKSIPMRIWLQTFNDTGTKMFENYFVYNWSEDKQTKTFK